MTRTGGNMEKYDVQVENKTYSVEIEKTSNMHQNDKTAEDIAKDAFLSEYDHCVQRAEKLDNKVYILLTVCAFLFVLLTSTISEAAHFAFPHNGLAFTLIMLYVLLLICDVAVYSLMLIKLVGLLKSVPFARFNTRERLKYDLIAQTPETIARYLGTKYVRCIDYNNELLEKRYKAFNFCVNLLVTDVVISILLAFVCVFISLNGGMRV